MGRQNLAVLVVGEENKDKIERITSRFCDYCRKPLPRRHFVSSYGGRYCDSNCHRMYTED
jgi:hypothetical protein